MTAKKTTWNKKIVAENYDFGRPLDESVLIKLFPKVGEYAPFSKKRNLLDAGCGTGRVTVPLAKHFPNMHITGIDIAKEMLQVLHQKLKADKISNYTVRNGDLLQLALKDNFFDISLISSVLHGIKQWQKAIDEIIRVTKSHGYILLLSEQSDLYNLGLGRVKSENKNLLEKFWGMYIAYRAKNGLENPENSQIGIPWQLGYPAILQYFTQKQIIAQTHTIKMHWENRLTVSDLMKIIKGKSWSSLFTAPTKNYENLVKDMEQWIKEQHISSHASCLSKNILMCEVIEITK